MSTYVLECFWNSLKVERRFNSKAKALRADPGKYQHPDGRELEWTAINVRRAPPK